MHKKKLTFKISTRLISLFLSLLLFFLAVPPIIYAEAAEAVKGEESENASSALDGSYEKKNEYSYDGELYEVVELREENVKHFHLADGSYIAAEYPSAVHIPDGNGGWVDIDNTLYSVIGDITTADSRIKFARFINGGANLFTLHNGSAKITMNLVGANKGVLGEVTNGEDAEELTELGKMLSLEKLTSAVIYRDILSGVDIEYVISASSVKENIIIKEKRDSYSYSFELKLNGLTASLEADGSVSLVNGEGALTYIIPAPVIYDANGVSGKASYALESEGGNGKYILTVSADSEWMSASERAFPVILDPAVSPSSSYVIDTSISSAAPTNTFATDTTLMVSSLRLIHWKTTSLPTIPNSAVITNATITLRSSGFASGNYIAAYEVLTDWNQSLTWDKYTSSTNPQGTLGEEIIDYNKINTPNYYTWNITSLVNKWYSGQNYGVGFNVVSGHSASVSFYSNEHSDTAYHPVLSVYYEDVKGVENYRSNDSHDVGLAGTGIINLFSGKLTFTIPTLTTTSGILQYTPTLVYDSSYSIYQSDYMGYKFKLNLQETIIKKSETQYQYSDADGTVHNFYLSGENSYTDESGKQLFLLPQSNGFLFLTDDSKLIKVFAPITASSSNEEWVLSAITDEDNNVLLFSFDELGRPTKISLVPAEETESIELLNFYYNNEKLQMIRNRYSNQGVIFKYSSTYNGNLTASGCYYLREVCYAHGVDYTVTDEDWNNAANLQTSEKIVIDATMQYEYDSDKLITSVKDTLTGVSVQYSWNNEKLTRVSEYSQSSILGQEKLYVYGAGYTDVHVTGNDEVINTADDIITRCIFDTKGRTVNSYSYCGDLFLGGVQKEYELQGNVINNVKKETVINGASINYILNGDFEESASITNFANWTISGNVTRSDDTEFEGEGNYCALFSPSSATTASLTQYLTLSSGNYTLSMPYITQKGIDIVGTVSIVSTSGSGFSHTERVSLNPNYSTGIEGFFSTEFTIPQTSNGKDNIKIVISFSAGSSSLNNPNIKIDRIMLERGIDASDFSLVTYGSFDANGLNSANVITPISNYWSFSSTNATNVLNAGGSYGNSLKLNAGITAKNYAKQRIYEISEEQLNYYDAGDQLFISNAWHDYIVSGYAKAENAVYSPNAEFRIRIDVIYYQGVNNSDVTVSYYFDFIPSVTEWQFVCGSFSTRYEKDEGDTYDYSCVKAIDIYCEYYNQPNGDAFFDNISVVNADNASIEKYSYYENGLVSKKENRFYKEYYEYDDNRNLKVVANNYGEIIICTYDSKNRITESVKYNFTYNSGYDYPYYLDNASTLITKTPISKTEYSYDPFGLCAETVFSELDENGNEISSLTNSYEYYTNLTDVLFGKLKYESGNGLNVYYVYDIKGQLISVKNLSAHPYGEETCEYISYNYTYDDLGNLIAVETTLGEEGAEGSAEVSFNYNSKNLLSSLYSETGYYSFYYDDFGNLIRVCCSGYTIEEYEYNQNNGKLKKVTYGNGLIEEYVYDALESLTEVWYTYSNGTREKAYEYEYMSDGQLYKYVDNIIGRSVVFKYDTNNRFIGFNEYKNDDLYHSFSSTVFYNDQNSISTLNYQIKYQGGTDSATYSYYYDYTTEGKLQTVNLYSPLTLGTEVYDYDAFDRVASSSFSASVIGNSSSAYSSETEYSYNTDSYLSNYVSTVGNTQVTSYSYSYDEMENINKISYGSGEEIRYYYDYLGQLLREDNEFFGETYVYTYDSGGNILSKSIYSLTEENDIPTSPRSVYTYTYSTGSSGDKLVSYNGNALTYDAMGNPLTYNNGVNYTFTWTGSRATSLVKSGAKYEFTYNDEGVRTSKSKNGVTTTYYLNGSQIIGEETNGNVTVYIYDAMGLPIGMQYHGVTYAENAWDIFWFEKNALGDITAVYNQAGTKLISYYYDAWGNWMSMPHNGGYSTKAYDNPFRYRGYYYDADINLYVTATRYYDSATGRFISPDDISYLGENGDINSYNLYAYCSNNPIMYVDPSGHGIIASMLIAFVIGFVMEYIPDVITEIKEDGFQWSDLGDPLVENFNKYILSGLESVVLAAAYNIGVGLGTAAYKTGTVISKAKVVLGLVLSFDVAYVAGMGIYSLGAAMGEYEYSYGDMVEYGTSLGMKAAFGYGVGLAIGNLGISPNFNDKKVPVITKIKETIIRNYYKIPITNKFNRYVDQHWEV